MALDYYGLNFKKRPYTSQFGVTISSERYPSSITTLNRLLTIVIGVEEEEGQTILGWSKRCAPLVPASAQYKSKYSQYNEKKAKAHKISFQKSYILFYYLS